MPPKILFLTLRTFSLTGGIETVCRVFSRVLFDLGFKLETISVFSMYDFMRDRDARYINRVNFKAFGGERTLFVGQAILKGLQSDILILSHINLLFVAIIIKRLSPKTRIVVYAHGTEIWRELKTWKQKFLARKCEIWTVSEFTANKLRLMHHVPAKNIKLVPNCLDPFLDIPLNFEKPGSLLEKYGLSKSQPILFTLSRLSNMELYKGYDTVIEALPLLIKEFPDLHYLLAGRADEKEQARLETLIEKLKLSKHITLIGFIPDDEINIHFLLTDVFVMPSRKEGFGIVFIEAAACGCKIIGGSQDGSSQALLQGRLGTLVDPEEKGTLIQAISDNLRQPRNLKNAKAIQTLCLEQFNYQQYLQKIQSLLLSESPVCTPDMPAIP